MSKYVDGINEERFELFLKDLRSGEYQQGNGALHTIDRLPDGSVVEKLCCLGVACIRPAAEGVIEVHKRGEDEDQWYQVRYDGWNTTDLPLAVADYLGIPEANRVDMHGQSCNVVFLRMGWTAGDYNKEAYTAIGLNDRLGKTLSQIADAFEAEFRQ